MTETFRPAADGPHLHDDELLALAADMESGWDRAGGSGPDHVRACAACGMRLQGVQAWLQSVAHAATADADAAFPASRLAAQRDAIMRRLEGAQNRRVIPFPAAPPAGSPSPSFHPRRWVAAAAAAGLVAGLLTGRVLWDQESHAVRDRGRSAVVATRPHQAAEPRIEHALSQPSDEVFLTEVELALQSPRVHELEAIDALTPRVRQ